MNKCKLYNSHSSPINLQLNVFYYHFNIEPTYDVRLEVPANREIYSLVSDCPILLKFFLGEASGFFFFLDMIFTYTD